VRRLKDRTEEAVSNGNSREILNWRYNKTKLLVEKRVVGETKEQRGRPSFIDAIVDKRVNSPREPLFRGEVDVVRGQSYDNS